MLCDNALSRLLAGLGRLIHVRRLKPNTRIAALSSTLIVVAMNIRATSQVPQKPDLRYLARVVVVRVMVQATLDLPVNFDRRTVNRRAMVAIESALKTGGITVPGRRVEDLPPEAGRVPWQTLVFHVQASTARAIPGALALAYQAELVEYTPYPVDAGIHGYSMPLVLWRDAATQLIPLGSRAELSQKIENLAAAAATRCAKAIAEGRAEARLNR